MFNRNLLPSYKYLWIAVPDRRSSIVHRKISRIKALYNLHKTTISLYVNLILSFIKKKITLVSFFREISITLGTSFCLIIGLATIYIKTLL